MRLTRVVLCLLLTYTLQLHSQAHATPQPGLHSVINNCTTGKGNHIVTGAFQTAAFYNSRCIIVDYVNPFRFQIGAMVNSTSIAAATVPGQLQVTNPPAAGAAKVQAGNTQTADFSKAVARRENTAPAPTDSASQFLTVQAALAGAPKKIASIREKINKETRRVSDEQRCYQAIITTYSQPILQQQDADNLIIMAKAEQMADSTLHPATSCRPLPDDTWPFGEADSLAANLTIAQGTLQALPLASDYSTWLTPANQAAYNAAVSLVNGLLQQAQGYDTGSVANDPAVGEAYTAYIAVVDSNQLWRSRLDKIADSSTACVVGKSDSDCALQAFVPLPPCEQWYGRGRTDTLAVQYTDLSVSGSSQQTVTVATNTCNPLSIGSTGIGVTFLPNPTYGFVPSDNTNAQVIGETAVNDASPLYAVLYNVAIAPPLGKSGIELFASPGVGLTSASSTTTTDFLAGLSLGFGRRLIFLTGSADFGQRTELLPGFSIGTAQGMLSSVPTHTNWKTGAMLSVTFGIGPS